MRTDSIFYELLSLRARSEIDDASLLDHLVELIETVIMEAAGGCRPGRERFSWRTL